MTCAAALILSSCQGDRRPEVTVTCRTTKTAAVTATAPDAHGHPVQELFMPLSGARNRCPRRGRIEIVLHTSASAGQRSVHVVGLGADRRELVKAGPGVALPPLPLVGLSTGTHPVSIEVDGQSLAVPPVLVTP